MKRFRVIFIFMFIFTGCHNIPSESKKPSVSENINIYELDSKKKEDFVRLLLPHIQSLKQQIQKKQKLVQSLQAKQDLNTQEKKALEDIFNEYKLAYGDFKGLKSRLIVYPTSLILAQGAIESGWGKSRFFKQAKNIFGMWTYEKNVPCVKAKQTQGSTRACLKKFDDFGSSVKALVMLISTKDAYKELRAMLVQNKNPYESASGLLKYSQERELYIEKVRKVIIHNGFLKYDI